jgi:biotin operon repressor
VATTAATKPRRRSEETGRLEREGPLDLLSLYETVKSVALVASQQFRCEPHTLTIGQWESVRETWPAPQPPPAGEVCRLLRPRGRKRLPWRELLERLFDEEATLELQHVRSRQAARSEDFTEAHCEYALRRVGLELGRQPNRREYTSVRNRLIDEDTRAWKTGGSLAAVLPTLSQLEAVCDGYDNALVIAGYRERDESEKRGRREKGVPIADAGARFYRETGLLPTVEELRAFAADKGFALASKDRSRDWALQVREDICARIAELGWPEPPAYDPRGRTEKPRWSRELWVEDGEAEYRPAGYWTTTRAVIAVREFLEVIGLEYPSQDLYEETRLRDRHDWPSASTIQESFDVFPRFVAYAKHPDALQLAADQDGVADEQAEVERRARLVDRAFSAKAEAVYAVIAESERTVALPAIAAKLDWKETTVSNWLRPLKKSGRVVQHGAGKNARYTIPGRLPEKYEQPAVLPARKQDWPQAQKLRDALAEHGPASSEHLQAALGWSTKMLWDWLQVLRGSGEVVSEGASKQRRHRLAEQSPRPVWEEPEAQQLLAALREHGGEMSPKQLMEKLGWKAHKTVKRWAMALVAGGLAEERGTTASRRYRAAVGAAR